MNYLLKFAQANVYNPELQVKAGEYVRSTLKKKFELTDPARVFANKSNELQLEKLLPYELNMAFPLDKIKDKETEALYIEHGVSALNRWSYYNLIEQIDIQLPSKGQFGVPSKHDIMWVCNRFSTGTIIGTAYTLYNYSIIPGFNVIVLPDDYNQFITRQTGVEKTLVILPEPRLVDCYTVFSEQCWDEYHHNENSLHVGLNVGRRYVFHKNPIMLKVE